MDVRTIQTPVGLLKLTAGATALTGIWLNARGTPDRTRATGVFAETEQQLKAYFAGTLETFDLPIALTGTPFQCEVWTMLRYIPFGETCSYAEIADRIGRPKAVRAVGAANGQNPIPIVIPCHRVIGKDGSLTGFAGGLKLKAWLLNHEQRQGQLFEWGNGAMGQWGNGAINCLIASLPHSRITRYGLGPPPRGADDGGTMPCRRM